MPVPHAPDHPRRRLLTRVLTRPRLGAIFLLVCALITGIESAGLRLGSARMMGPGYFPSILTGLFGFFALLMLMRAGRDDLPADFGPLRPAVLVIAAVAAFALLLPVTGAAIAVAVTVVLAALAESGRRPLELLVLVLALVAMVWLLFRLGLKLQLPMLPGGRE